MKTPDVDESTPLDIAPLTIPIQTGSQDHSPRLRSEKIERQAPVPHERTREAQVRKLRFEGSEPCQSDACFLGRRRDSASVQQVSRRDAAKNGI